MLLFLWELVVENILGSRVVVSCLTRGASVIKDLGVNTVLKIEKQIEGLPVKDFAELAAWMWERVEDDSMLRACVDAVEEGNERASRDEIFGILDGNDRGVPSEVREGSGEDLRA